jgi:hypothetical protein
VIKVALTAVTRWLTSIPAGVTITRPNDTTAYAAGQVYGPAVDARIAIPVPALPIDAIGTSFTQMQIEAYISRPVSDTIVPLNGYLFNALPTLHADKDPIALVDTDIPKLVLANTSPSAIQTATATNSGYLNGGVGVLGRRSIGSISVVPTVGITPSSTLYLLLKVSGIYTPVANEKVFLFYSFAYSVAPLV